MPVGADREVSSNFQLIAGTNRDLCIEAQQGRFRADLLARLDLWTYVLPGLRDRASDIESNVDYELARYARESGNRTSFNKEALRLYLKFATSHDAAWLGNFRDLGASITRMATLANNGRIDEEIVREEMERLQTSWTIGATKEVDSVEKTIGAARAAEIDPFDRVQLAEVISVVRASPSLSAAGRALFSVSRMAKRSINDADRLKKYLARFELDWESLKS